MGDRLTRALKKLSASDRKTAENLIERIIAGNLRDLDVKRLKGYADAFRVRKGELRVIFTVTDGRADIIAVERRSESTYRL